MNELTLARWYFSGPFSVLAAGVPRLPLEQIARLAVVVDGAVNVQIVTDDVAPGRHLGLLALDHCARKFSKP